MSGYNNVDRAARDPYYRIAYEDRQRQEADARRVNDMLAAGRAKASAQPAVTPRQQLFLPVVAQQFLQRPCVIWREFGRRSRSARVVSALHGPACAVSGFHHRAFSRVHTLCHEQPRAALSMGLVLRGLPRLRHLLLAAGGRDRASRGDLLRCALMSRGPSIQHRGENS